MKNKAVRIQSAPLYFAYFMGETVISVDKVAEASYYKIKKNDH